MKESVWNKHYEAIQDLLEKNGYEWESMNYGFQMDFTNLSSQAFCDIMSYIRENELFPFSEGGDEEIGYVITIPNTDED